MKFLLGKKIDMTQVWQGDEVVAVTRLQAGPCTVVQLKNKDRDGYIAVQIGFGEKKEKNIAKPQLGHMKKVNVKSRYLREFRCENIDNLKIGDMIDVNTFEVGNEINVIGTSKGKGFQGVVKRHGFHGHNTTHGTKDQVRMPGSIGAGGVQRVFKGKRMGGRMGDERVTVKGSEIIEIDKENNILSIKGGVPGARNGLVMIIGEGELKTISNEQLTIDNKTEESKAEEKIEEVKNENAEMKNEDIKAEEVKMEEVKS